jgi:ribosomal-protein-alanine N-acetyltransferase
MINTQIFESFPTIETDRLILRELKNTDVQKLFELQSNEDVNQYIHGRTGGTEEEALKFIEFRKTFFEKKWGITWVGTVKETDEFLGICSFNAIDVQNHRAEISGELHPQYWRTHVGQETFLSVIKFGFENLNLHSITAKCSPKNTATIGILEKFGFVKEGHLIDRTFTGSGYEDQCLYSLLKGSKTFEELLKQAQKKHVLQK